MCSYPPTIGLFFFCFTVITNGSNDPARIPGDISINCGSTVSSAAIINGREWIGDIQPTISSTLQIIKGSSSSSTAINTKFSSTNPVPHDTARISRSRFLYAFKLNPGQIILRLHFNSAVYRGFKGLRDLFTVEAGPFILLSNFSPSLTADAHGVNTFVKEFCFTILENQELDVVFSPTSTTSQDNTYAFINGIEIISIPEQLSYFGGDLGTQIIGQQSMVYIENTTALELVHRISVKRDSAPAGDDFDDMVGMLKTVQKQKVNHRDNLTWMKSVDVGFSYLVRIFFSDSELKTAETGGLIFKVLINERVVDTSTDILAGRRDGHGKMWYRDYKVVIKGRKQEGKRALSISLHPNDEIREGHRFLKGFEIYKLSNPDNSLASPNALPTSRDSPSRIIKSLQSGFSQRNAIATVATAILIMLDVIIYTLQIIRKSSIVEDENKPLTRAERICRRFSLKEMRVATNNFSDAFLIGKGGFSKVYRGLIDNGQQTVAIKRCSREGEHEFLTEIETLSEVQHINLVSLIGYCSERREMILVYEYMAHGTLADYLYKLPCDGNNYSPLTWKQWLNICIGAGRGLDYLHTGCGVIHRDVKTSNILLDENFVPKVSDFGLAKPQDMLNLKSHVDTKVKGTPGYLDPHYYSTGKLTRKSDIYAFGVVLLEVLCVRPAVESMLGEDAYNLHKWARNKIGEGEIKSIIHPILRGEVSSDSLKVFVGVAERCLHDDPKERPTMAQVVLQLEVALEQQDIPKVAVPNETMNSTAAATEACPSEEGNVASFSREQRKEASSAAAGTPPSPLTKPPNIETNNNGYTAGRKRGKKQKPQKNSWPWTFWKIPKLFKEEECNISDIDFFGEEIYLPRYDLATIRNATKNYSRSNEIGDGKIGIFVYEAVLPSGQRVAIKLFSLQRLEEFKSEICLAHRLHHRNIIELLGYAINDKEQGMIVYEFMENGSLHAFLFDERHRLQWSQRFKIIMGIAKAVVHLHENSEPTLIHRDIKPSNIWLDNEMNPKLSGFSLLRTLNHIDDTCSTTVAGTPGYIAPECYKTGKVTSKVDVYSFGVVVMEILNDLRIHEYAINGPNLIQHLWDEGRTIMDLVDESLGGEYSADEALRCIQVSLLCIQWSPSDRPEMSSVLKMLLGEDSSLQEKVKEAASRERKWNINGNFSNEKYSNSTATFEYDDTLER